jgi:carboxylesterase type B
MVEANDPFNALPQSEDCLTLSIFRPVGVSKWSQVPVLFWIHGGAFLNGAGINFDCDSIANRSAQLDEPVIVVAINYRLNFFGFSCNDGSLA